MNKLTNNKNALKIRVEGLVQGVGFRAAARSKARSLQLKGYVENLPDGSVRALVSGNNRDCKEFIRWCREGSAYSWVEKVDPKEVKADLTRAFFIRY